MTHRSGRMTVAASIVIALLGSACDPRTANNSGSQTSATPGESTARSEITAMMTNSARAWNRGDLDAFVDDYEPDSSTTYIGRQGVVRGRTAIRAVYAPRFAPGGVRDSLSFEDTEVDLLTPDVANVIAYYRLMRGDSTTARGPTSLVMRRTDGRWRIVHDHSS